MFDRTGTIRTWAGGAYPNGLMHPIPKVTVEHSDRRVVGSWRASTPGFTSWSAFNQTPTFVMCLEPGEKTRGELIGALLRQQDIKQRGRTAAVG